ncbi:MAG: transporter [Acidobacteria bacterium]|nr:transporter [Acidobacteriota bacterium]MCB9398365.1 transporter [Acidobacteriota bacterium]
MKFWTIAALLFSTPLWGQLNQTFSDLVNEVLINRLVLSPGEHASHFREQAALANQQLVPALNALIATNISSFPNNSTASGVTYDFSSGAPKKIVGSLGPIFGETASTLGRKKMYFNVNASHLSLDRFRGLKTQDIRFTFTHLDVSQDGHLGDNPNESDTIDLFLDMDVNAEIYALTFAYGLTDSVDFSLGVPFVSLDLGGTATARINSFTFSNLGMANHNFGPDPTQPQLETQIPYGGSASGIGDIAVRFKFNFLQGKRFDLALQLDARLPTGDEKDFLGTGKTSFRISELISKRDGDFCPHLNLSYEKRGAQLDSDELQIVAGFDHKMTDSVTIAAELMGYFDLNDSENVVLFPGSVTIEDHVAGGALSREIDLSNIPERSDDNTYSGALGFRYGPSDRFNLLANIIVPLNDAGLRSNVAATVGFSYAY